MMTDIPMNIKIGQYFSLAEMCASDTAKAKGIDNRPSVEAAVNLTLLCTKVLDPLCEAMGPVQIRSGYRCKELNDIQGGKADSKHTRGQAADIDIMGDLAYGKRLFAWIKANVEFDQLIWEYNSAGVCWIHVSYNLDGNRKKTFELKKTR
jgi:hypothetical protein